MGISWERRVEIKARLWALSLEANKLGGELIPLVPKSHKGYNAVWRAEKVLRDAWQAFTADEQREDSARFFREV